MNVHPGVAIIVIAIAVICVYLRGWGPGSQINNLDKINQWITNNKSTFDSMQQVNPELNDVRLYGWTGDNGMLGIMIHSKMSEKSRLELYEWVLKNRPPRPIYLQIIKDAQ